MLTFFCSVQWLPSDEVSHADCSVECHYNSQYLIDFKEEKFSRRTEEEKEEKRRFFFA